MTGNGPVPDSFPMTLSLNRLTLASDQHCDDFAQGDQAKMDRTGDGDRRRNRGEEPAEPAGAVNLEPLP